MKESRHDQMQKKIDGGVKSVRTLLSIITFLRDENGARVTELANGLEIAKSTVHRHLTTLEEQEYIIKDGNEYHLSLKFLDIGIYTRNQYRLYNVSQPKLVELVEQTGERAWCMVEEGGIGTYLCGESGKHPVKPPVREGQQTFLHQTAAGKSILANLPDERIEWIIDRHGLPEKTEKTITDREKLLKELERVRENGIAFNKQETIPRLHAVGAPILNNQTNDVLGSISVSGPANRLNTDVLENEIAELILGIANEIEINITYNQND